MLKTIYAKRAKDLQQAQRIHNVLDGALVEDEGPSLLIPLNEVSFVGETISKQNDDEFMEKVQSNVEQQQVEEDEDNLGPPPPILVPAPIPIAMRSLSSSAESLPILESGDEVIEVNNEVVEMEEEEDIMDEMKKRRTIHTLPFKHHNLIIWHPRLNSFQALMRNSEPRMTMLETSTRCHHLIKTRN